MLNHQGYSNDSVVTSSNHKYKQVVQNVSINIIENIIRYVILKCIKCETKRSKNTIIYLFTEQHLHDVCIFP